jgi:hypothetical protein
VLAYLGRAYYETGKDEEARKTLEKRSISTKTIHWRTCISGSPCKRLRVRHDLLILLKNPIVKSD